MKRTVSSVWLVTREYAGIAEAGGVKNVATSLSEALARAGVEVTVFIPKYGFVTQESELLFSSDVPVGPAVHAVDFSACTIDGVRIVFVSCDLYRAKRAVYTYTDEDAPDAIGGSARGKGHADAHEMNMVLQKSVCRYALETGTVPDIVHCQDAHTALLPALALRGIGGLGAPGNSPFAGKTGFVVTIHNAGPGYRQSIPGLLRAEALTGLDGAVLSRGMLGGSVEPFLVAADFSTLTTVSPWYAEELRSSAYDGFTDGLSGEFGRRNVPIVGITNGIDRSRYDPSDTGSSLLPFPFNPVSGDLAGKYATRDAFLAAQESLDVTPGITRFGTIEDADDAVWFSYHGRIAWQKGIDVLEKTARAVLANSHTARFVVLGQGDPTLESLLISMSGRYAGRFMYVRGYERSLARMAVAISDFIVLPSAFEPCGLEDYIAQVFGTIPVAHAVGGLRKIIDGKNGFLYGTHESNDPAELASRLLELEAPIARSRGRGAGSVPDYLGMIRFAAERVRDECDWDRIVADSWLPLYAKALPGGA